jgi:hypothetical protein
MVGRSDTGRAEAAGSSGGVGVFLFLSLWHCSAAISSLMGVVLLLSVLLAVGIDCGLVVSDVAMTAVSSAALMCSAEPERAGARRGGKWSSGRTGIPATRTVAPFATLVAGSFLPSV